MELLDSPPHTVDVYASVESIDAEGGRVVAYPTKRLSGMKCLIRGASSTEQVSFLQQQIVCTHVIASKQGNSVNTGDLITYKGRQFHVTGNREQDDIGMSIPTWYEIYVEEKKVM